MAHLNLKFRCLLNAGAGGGDLALIGNLLGSNTWKEAASEALLPSLKPDPAASPRINTTKVAVNKYETIFTTIPIIQFQFLSCYSSFIATRSSL